MRRVIRIAIVVLATLAASVSGYSQGQVPDAEELQALKDLYDSLGGSAWTNNPYWPTSGTLPVNYNQSYGVWVQNGDIVRIYLQNSNVAGKIPASIKKLKALQWVFLYSNRITGSIPAAMGELPNLQYIFLEYNQLSGSIPAALGNATALKVLHLSANQLSGAIPAELNNLVNLYDLSLGVNSLSGAIPNLGGLTELTYLALQRNNFTAGAIPQWITTLPKLQQLYLSFTNRTGTVPTQMGNMQTLLYLELQNNQLTGSFPTFLTGIPNLGAINLSTNQFSGSLPASIGSMAKLTQLYLNNNTFTGPLPKEIGNLNLLTHLYLNANKFSGELPAEFGNLTKLQVCFLSVNKFVGRLPASLASLVNLGSFYIEGNQFEGEFPSYVGNWTKLTALSMNGNKFHGAFPSAIGNCALLNYMRADNNFFTSLPATMLNLPNLALNFENNDLTSIPNFANHVRKSTLTVWIKNNRLDFSQLQPMMNAGIASFACTPQKNIRDVSVVTFAEGQLLTIPGREPGTGTTVVWEKQQPNGTWAAFTPAQNEDATQKTFKKSGATKAMDAGVYRWRTTNSSFPGSFVIMSDAITVQEGKQNVLDNWAFQYKYDKRKRMTHKKVPGADWVYMVYDERDRLVLTQDGEQRKTNKWTFTKYDALNRPVLTGIYTHTGIATQADMSGLVSATVSETFDGSPMSHGYTKNAFPNDMARIEYLTVTYYDNYAFNQNDAAFAYVAGDADCRTQNGHEYCPPDAAFAAVKGQVTGTKARAMDNDPYWLRTTTYYDDKYRPIQTISDHQRTGFQRTTNVYDFTGKVLVTKTTTSEDKIQWKDLVGVKVEGDKLIKTATSNTWGTAGAASQHTVPAGQNGWVEFVYNPSIVRVVGFSDTNPDASFTTIDYGLYAGNTDNKLQVYENGVYRATNDYLEPGEILRVERAGSTIHYKRNGFTFYTSTVPSTTSLIADAALNTQGTFIYRGRSSFSITPAQTITRLFTYDHAGRLLEAWHSLNEADPVLLAQNEYNELGQLITKKLHQQPGVAVEADPLAEQPGVTYSEEIVSDHYNGEPAYVASQRIHLQGGFVVPTGSAFQGRIGYSQADADAHNSAAATFAQVIDYRYNIRGWLTRINHADVTVADNAGEPRDHFGMNLAYNEVVSGLGNEPAYNGNISAITWSNSQGYGTVKENAYKYNYDPMNRIAGAAYRQRNTGGWGLPEHVDGNNTVASDAYTETGYQYDLNGNLQELTRYGKDGLLMDDLTYAYGDNELKSNRLLSVTDGGDTYKGFADGNVAGDDYAYDANGNMTVDKNKGITAIAYNHLNLPERVTKSTGDYVKYVYDAGGRKLSQQVYNPTGVLQKKSDYLGEYFYENDTLKFINHEEGRIVTTGTAPEYQYHLKDHLGNVRLTFTTKEETEESLGTLEPVNANDERSKFLRYDNVRKVEFAMFDHTNGAADGYAMRLSGGTNEKFGLAKSLSVMPGDTIKMEVYAKYLTAGASQNTNVAELLAQFNGQGGSASIVDGGAYAASTITFPFIGLLVKGEEEPTVAPKAYLNWLVFDRNYNLIASKSSYRRVTTAGAESGQDIAHEKLDKQIEIEEAGYVYIYLSNEEATPVEVFFDDFKVEHTQSPVVQSDEYYPFGLAFNSCNREKNVANAFRFQSQEHINSLAIGWESFKWRNHQSDIGRFFNIDPLSEEFQYNSPYAFSENKLGKGIELEGLEIVEGLYYYNKEALKLAGLGDSYLGKLNQAMYNRFSLEGRVDQLVKTVTGKVESFKKDPTGAILNTYLEGDPIYGSSKRTFETAQTTFRLGSGITKGDPEAVMESIDYGVQLYSSFKITAGKIDPDAVGQLEYYNRNPNTFLDCSDIAAGFNKLYKGGSVLEITPKTGRTLNGIEYGKKESFTYHQVYQKDGFIYDPMLSDQPIKVGDFFQLYNQMNPDGLNVTQP